MTKSMSFVPSRGVRGTGLCLLSFIACVQHAAADGSCNSGTVRWATSSNTIYVTGPAICTLQDLDAIVPSSMLQKVDVANHIYHLKANLTLELGGTLLIHGPDAGGDVAELRLRSNNDSNAASTIRIRAQWGAIDIASTLIRSWNDATQAPDTEYTTFKRSFIQVRSFLDTDGITPRESRMDIRDSEIAYLGYNASESYGLVWKVIGSGAGLYDQVNVYGDVVDNHIHHNYMGAYTYGAQDMLWSNNEIANNVSYGLDPHDDSDGLTIENNNSHHNGNHGVICSQRCDHLTIVGNQVHHNTGNGIMIHRNVTDSILENNQVFSNTDSGIALFESHNNTLRGNLAYSNLRGIRLSVGSANNTIEDNEIRNNQRGFYLYKGSDAPTSGNGRPKFNLFRNNNVHDNSEYALSLTESDNNTFEDNLFTNNTKHLLLDRGVDNLLTGNQISPTSTAIETKGGNSSSPGRTTIRSPANLTVKLNSYGRATLVDPEGRIFDPEENGETTTVTPGGSSLEVTHALIGSQSFVTARNFWVKPESGSSAVGLITWQTGGALLKQWAIQADATGQIIDYVVGDLAANATYRVFKNNTVIDTVITDGNGKASFSDVAGTISTVTYEVRP